MTSLPSENAPQLGTCSHPRVDIDGFCFKCGLYITHLAAPENQPRPTTEMKLGQPLRIMPENNVSNEWQGEAQVEKHPPVDELLSKIEAYRTGYSCGYSDAKAGSRMRDKDAAALFYGIEGVPDIFADDSPLTPYGEKLKLMKVGEAQVEVPQPCGDVLLSGITCTRPLGHGGTHWSTELNKQALWKKARVEPGAHPPPDYKLAEHLAHEIWDNWHGPLAKIPTTHQQAVKELLEMLGRFERARAPQPVSSECGEPVCHLIAGASWFACALPKGHKQEGHRGGGDCFKHGPYVMDQGGVPPQRPKWPDCIKGMGSIWSTPATNAGPSRNLSNSSNAETTGTISAPSASESSSPSQQSIEPTVASSKLSAQEFWHSWTQGASDPYTTTVSKATMFEFAEAYAREYASSSNAELASRFRIAQMQLQTYSASVEAAESEVTTLEGQLREAQEELKRIKEGV